MYGDLVAGDIVIVRGCHRPGSNVERQTALNMRRKVFARWPWFLPSRRPPPGAAAARPAGTVFPGTLFFLTPLLAPPTGTLTMLAEDNDMHSVLSSSTAK